MIRTRKQLQTALRKVNDIDLRVEKVGIAYRVSYGLYRLTCYSVQDLVQEMNKETVALNYAYEGLKTIYIKGLKAEK